MNLSMPPPAESGSALLHTTQNVRMMGLLQLAAAAVVLGAQLSGVSAAEVPINTPSPMFEPRYPHCEQFARPSRRNTWCSDMAAQYRITREEWDLWNPSHPFNTRACIFHMYQSYWFCVKAKDNAPPPAYPGSTVESPPAPTVYNPQKGEVPQGARKFSQARPQDEAAAETEHEPSKPEPEDPETTKAPPPPEQNQCRFGDCWYAFGTLSSDKHDEDRSEAMKLCTQLFHMDCKDHRAIGFPGEINDLCGGCEELSSACPCFTAGRYHTRTVNPYLFSRPRQQKPGDFLAPGM
ncbi:hypothetical protein ACJ41O_008529 [Fusarium nematophilum]